MIVNSAYRFKLKTRSRVERVLNRYAGSCRFIWNKLLRLQKDRLDWDEYTLNYAALCEIITCWKTERYPWLNETPSQSLQQVARDLSTAITNAFDKEMPQAFPVFKKKTDANDSFRIPQGFKWERTRNKIKIPKLGWIKYFSHSDVDKIKGEPGQVTISREGPDYFISIHVSYEMEDPVHPHHKAVGIDRGVVNFAYLSDGTFFKPLVLEYYEMKLKEAQRELSRKVKFSKNWQKQVAVVGSWHRKIARCHDDHTSKVSTIIGDKQAYPILEALKIMNMTASAAGTVDAPGKNVAAKSGLNRSILDQRWGQFDRKLTYKEKWRGGLVIKVPPHYTSQDCPECNHRDPGNRKTRETFCCLKCGYIAPADFVAARNILRRGTPFVPVEGEVANPMKQEPIRPENPNKVLLAGIPGL